MLRSYDDAVVDAGQLMGARADVERSPAGLKSVIGLSDFPNRFGELEPRSYDFELIGVVFVKKGGRHAHSLSIIGGNNAGGGNKGDENSGSQLQAPTVSVTGMDVVGERVTAKASNLPEGANQVSYQWQYSATKTGTFSDIKYGGNKNSYEISEEDEDYYLRCKVTTSSSKGKVPDAYSETIGKVYVFDWSNYPTGSYRPRFNGNSLACCAAPYDSSTQIPSLGEGDYASIVFDNELSDIPQGNITYRWFKCAGLGSGAPLVAKELGSSPSLSLSGLQGSYINCEVTLTVNGKSKTFVPKAICNGKLSDGIYVRPRIG